MAIPEKILVVRKQGPKSGICKNRPRGKPER